METELQQIKSYSTNSSAEVESLKARILTLEATNRDTIAVVEAKSTANDALAQDLQKQHSKGLELSQQISALQQQLQNADSTASSAKFRQQSLNQELEQAKRNNEWYDNELKTKSAEALKFRKEKGARISELQRLNEDANATIEALKKTEGALRNRLEEVQTKAEDALSQVQQLQESAAGAEEGFRQELESCRRLADLRAQQTETHRNRLEEVEASLEKLKDDASEQIHRYEQELEAERQQRAQCEARIEELEAEIDRLEASASQPQHYASSVPGTPRASLNGLARAASPFGTPGSVRGKSSITATQALDELYKVRGQLATEKRLSQRLANEMEEMIQGLEAKQPEIEELHAEHGRLQQEVVEMSKFVDHSGKEAERAKKEARKAENDASTARAEAAILTQQLRDLSVQIKMLLVDMDARDRGLDTLSDAERAQLDRLSRGEVGEESLEGLTDTDHFISQRLTVFRSVAELQEKNQELLKITRQLGAQMESEEALAAKHQAASDHEQVEVLQQRIEGYKDELQSMVVRSDSYIKERDMFRRMLQHRGQLPPASDIGSMFAQSVDGNTLGDRAEQGSNKEESQVTAVALRELQRHFDQYREEQSVDRRTLKEQTEKLTAEKGGLQAEIAKASSQLTLATERYEMLQANYAMLQNENKELQKRSQALSETAAKQDLRTQQVAEDLIEAKGLVESMRNETANLKAEKKLWKEIQDRLSQDNENLQSERNRLNGVIASQQSLQNERELTEKEERRRLQTQAENLEKELHATKRKLNDEIEDNKKAQLRKEYDSQQNQKRIDDLASSLSSIKEELAVAKNTRDHLQARVDELTIELKSAEERVEVLQPRPTPRPGTHIVSDDLGNSAVDGLNREQELAIEVSELKRDLDLARGEADSLKAQTEQFKAISQASEEDLQNFTETQEQYREEMDKIIEEKDAKIRELQQRIEDLSSELSAANNELNTIRDQQSEVARHASAEKTALEEEIARLRDEDERHATIAQFHQQDLRAQAEIATKAQQDYEQELVKHAAAAQMLQTLRTEYNNLKSESAALKAEAESAKATLGQSQTSWEERREQFERELSELRARRDDIAAQNKLLLHQLESVNSQVTTLQQSRAANQDNNEAESTSKTKTDPSVEGLRELVTYLRRDKEIVDVQYELSMQEAKRLRQQLEYSQSQLDEARLKLDQKRRSQAEGSRNSLAHKDLMEKLNELNLFRESSITLRNEAKQAQIHLSEEKRRSEELQSKLEPLETKLRELENVKEMQDGEIRLLQEDRDRWQKRNQEILSKYDRIDPAEMEQLKQSVASLQAERDAMAVDQEPLKEKISGLETEKSAWTQTRQKIIDQAKERNRVLTKEKNDRAIERDAAIQEKENAEQQLAKVKEELDKSIEEKLDIEQQLKSAQDELAAATAAKDQASSAPPLPSDAPNNPPQLQDQTQINELQDQLDTVRKDLELAKAESIQVEQTLTTLRQELDDAKKERDEAVAKASQQVQPDATNNQNDGEHGSEEGQVEETQQASVSDTEKKALEEQLASAEARAAEAAAKAKQIEESMDATLKQRSEKMKSLLNTKLKESKEAARAALEEEYKLKLEQEMQIWLAEKVTDAVPAPPGTPAAGADVAAIPQSPPTKIPSTPADTKMPAAAADLSTLSDTQIRDFLSTNTTVKSILTNNLKKKLEVETQKLKADHDKSAAEAAKKAEDLKAQAVAMETKKSALKINLAENKFKAADYKIEIVKKAATDTPEKPVGEVWEIAKDAKPPPAVSVRPVAQLAASAPAVATPAAPISATLTTSTESGASAAPATAVKTGIPQSASTNGLSSNPATQAQVSFNPIYRRLPVLTYIRHLLKQQVLFAQVFLYLEVEGFLGEEVVLLKLAHEGHQI